MWNLAFTWTISMSCSCVSEVAGNPWDPRLPSSTSSSRRGRRDMLASPFLLSWRKPGAPCLCCPGVSACRLCLFVGPLHPHKTKSYLTPIRPHPSNLQCVVSPLKHCDIKQINLFCWFVFTISRSWSHRGTKRYTLPNTQHPVIESMLS